MLRQLQKIWTRGRNALILTYSLHVLGKKYLFFPSSHPFPPWSVLFHRIPPSILFHPFTLVLYIQKLYGNHLCKVASMYKEGAGKQLMQLGKKTFCCILYFMTHRKTSNSYLILKMLNIPAILTTVIWDICHVTNSINFTWKLLILLE